MYTASTFSPGRQVIMTVGHSNRSLPEFIALLQAHGVTQLVDVRTVPRSRHNPQFNQATLPAALQAVSIGYVHQPGLGGLRHPRPGSLNTGWRNASFRGFADYMQTSAFATALETLRQQAESQRVAVMCAEAVPWRCHRSLIADALSVRGIPVEHLLSVTQRQAHRLTPWAQVDGTRLSYPPPANPTWRIRFSASPRGARLALPTTTREKPMDPVQRRLAMAERERQKRSPVNRKSQLIRPARSRGPDASGGPRPLTHPHRNTPNSGL